jgi:hypothetical protein
MKIKNLALNLPIYFLYIFGSCILVMLAEALLVSVIEKFVVLPYSVLTIIRIVIYTPGVTAILAVLGYYEGYREGVCPLGETIGGGVLATVLHLLFAMLFKFQGFVSGGVRFTAGLLHNGMDITYESLINKTPYGLFLLVFVGYAAVYLVALTVAKYFGAQKRVMDRADLRKSGISE